MYDNAPEETRYIYTDFDSKGERLVGENHYSVTFRKGGLPPVNGFWSLTLVQQGTSVGFAQKFAKSAHFLDRSINFWARIRALEDCRIWVT